MRYKKYFEEEKLIKAKKVFDVQRTETPNTCHVISVILT